VANDTGTQPWRSGAESPSTPETTSAERQLELVDRILGLEAQVAELSISTTLTPSEQLRVEQQLARTYTSVTWRVGSVVAAPLRLIGRRLTR
jgi:hypothetical protein